mmetsp:Transcript_1640/g.3529  ORF Transcript_1640/g.3529 Transcript_1640/m.3529 type:complete len:186 (+) Transcript_1640:3278-3835(+)
MGDNSPYGRVLPRSFDAECMEQLRHTDSRPNLIIPGLYLGSVAAAQSSYSLRSLGITHILTVADAIPPKFPRRIEYKIVEVTDEETTALLPYFDECVEFIQKAIADGGSVLVHCLAGVSRSATIVTAYLMKVEGMDLNQALKHIRQKRPLANPNPGFINQLRDYSESLEPAEIYERKPSRRLTTC